MGCFGYRHHRQTGRQDTRLCDYFYLSPRSGHSDGGGAFLLLHHSPSFRRRYTADLSILHRLRPILVVRRHPFPKCDAADDVDDRHFQSDGRLRSRRSGNTYTFCRPGGRRNPRDKDRSQRDKIDTLPSFRHVSKAIHLLLSDIPAKARRFVNLGLDVFEEGRCAEAHADPPGADRDYMHR